MMRGPRITEIRFREASIQQVRHGLLGWVVFVLDGRFRIEGVAVRRTLGGRLALSYPARKDFAGRLHAFIRPIDDATRRSVEHQVLSHLRMEGLGE